MDGFELAGEAVSQEEERGEGQGGSRCGRSQGSENAVGLEGGRAAGAFRLCLGPGHARSGRGRKTWPGATPKLLEETDQ